MVRIELRGQESNLRTRGSKPRISTDRNYPASERVSCGSRTRLARLEAWSLCRSAKDTCFSAEGEGVEPVKAFIALGRHSDARADLERCAELAGEIPATRAHSLMNLARVHIHAGNSSAAREKLEEAKAVDGENDVLTESEFGHDAARRP